MRTLILSLLLSPMCFAQYVTRAPIATTTYPGLVQPDGISCAVTKAGVLSCNSGSPGGNAGGDLGGTYPNPSVLKLNGLPASDYALNPVLPSGVIADYQMLDGTGTTLADSSGNGNNATLAGGSSTAPTWITGGLQFTSSANGVELPAAVNVAQTFCMAFFIPPLGGGGSTLPSNSFPTLVSSTLGLSGLNLQYSQTGLYAVYQLQTLAAGSHPTQSSAILTSGFHSACFSQGTSPTTLDHYVVDGVEQSYSAQGASAGDQTSGNLYLGSTNSGIFVGSGFVGNMYRFTAYSSYLSVPQMQAATLALTSNVYARGISTTPLLTSQTGAQLHAIGDSITCAWNGSDCVPSFSWAAQLTLTNQPTYTVRNWGLFGITPEAVAGSEAWRVGELCQAQRGPAIAILELGINSGIQTGDTPLQAWQATTSEIQVLRSFGCRVFVGTILSAMGNAQAGGTLDAFKDAYDALVLQQALTVGANGVVDWAANPLLGADNAFSNTTYFQGDGVHPTATGQGLMATAASNSMNYYSGYTLAAPHVISSSVTLASGDRAVQIGTLSGNIALVMPDCTGPSGESYTIQNPQSTHTVTVTGGTSQPINGLTSAITIASNASVSLKIVANAKTVSGCQWSL